MTIVILRIGHRIYRDKRITTHVGLTARAFGAEGMLLAGSDKSVVNNIQDIVNRWGGSFWVADCIDWRQEIKRWREEGGKILHLTMYGKNLPDVIGKIDVHKLMVVVGAEKVPSELYDLADYNVGVTNQPHSEVAALGILLDWLQGGRELNKDFGGKTRIAGNLKGKGAITFE
jgi:tRNA (cytidine56-2'-O)-methyltransferase